MSVEAGLQPFYASEPDAALLPDGWVWKQVSDIAEFLSRGAVYDKKNVFPEGLVPVIDQSREGIIGFHNDTPGVAASESAPVITFANHTCEIRRMVTPFSSIQNIFPFVGKPGMDSDWLRYAVSGRLGTEEYKGHAPQFRAMYIPVPPNIEDQKVIAKTLYCLDEKIANNRALAADLEAMARAIFKSWFVDFDPVKAKMEGRAPGGMDANTAALFPDELAESELGLIPKGWEAMPFEKAFDFTMGQSPPGSELNEHGDGLPFFQGSADFNTVFPSFRVYCPTPRRAANENDVLFSVRAPVGDCNIAKGKCGIGRGLCAIRSKFAGTGVTYPWMKSITADLQRASGEGVVFSSLSKVQLASCPVVVAPGYVYEAADQILSPILNLMANLDEESIALASTRDTLLPRLISDKLQIAPLGENDAAV